MQIKQWSAAALVAAAVLTTAACGSPSPEANAKKVVELLTENKTDEAKQLMTEAAQKRLSGRSGLDILGSRNMTAECKASDGTKATEDGADVVNVPYDCGDSRFTIKVQVQGDLVDQIQYEKA